jgi:hypothetical protein
MLVLPMPHSAISCVDDLVSAMPRPACDDGRRAVESPWNTGRSTGVTERYQRTTSTGRSKV